MAIATDDEAQPARPNEVSSFDDSDITPMPYSAHLAAA